MTYELSDLLEAAKADAPAPRYGVEDAVAAGRRLRNRRRAAWSSAVAAVAVVAVAASIVVPGHRVVPPAVQPAPDLTATIQQYRAGQFTVTEPVQVSPGYEIAQIYDTRTGLPSTTQYVAGRLAPPRGTVVAYRRGVFDPAGFAAGVRVSINGVPGRAVPDAVAFPYADGSWAVVRSSEYGDLTRAELITVAAGLRIGPPRTPVVGFRLTKAPSGYLLDSGGPTDRADGGFSVPLGSYLRLVKGDVSYTGLRNVVTQPGVNGLIEVVVHPRPPGGKVQSACFPAEHRCYRGSADGEAIVEARGGRGASTAELLDVLGSVVPATLNDRATWYPLTEAVG